MILGSVSYALHIILGFVFAMFCLLLMLVILLQRGKGVGLAGAFGSGGAAGGAFGAKTGDVLTWVTIVGAGVFLLFGISLNYVFVPMGTPPVQPAITVPGGAPAGVPDAPPASTMFRIDPNTGEILETRPGGSIPLPPTPPPTPAPAPEGATPTPAAPGAGDAPVTPAGSESPASGASDDAAPAAAPTDPPPTPAEPPATPER
ncbi:MAG: preprotein translocase subunit SecG [Phycisphaerales bacterium]|nr:preprotein translocase subunit SecG [Phycisphaerales bacterium]